MARRPGRYVALALIVVTASLGAGACSSASQPSPPSGIDELAIPTPSPDPSDFVPKVDNPWLPLDQGSSWTYRASGTPTGTVTVRVLPDQESIAGVTTTALERTEPDGVITVDYYAQDHSGNVWWFGRKGSWRAGDDGAQAGLAMPAHPRLGDGWRTAYQAGAVEDQASVVSVDGHVTTPAGRYDHLVVLDSSSPLTPGESLRSFYARGVGLVEAVATEGPISLLELETGP